MSKIIIGKYLSGELGIREGTQYPLDSPTIIRKIKWSVVTSRKAILDKVYHNLAGKDITPSTIYDQYDDELIQRIIIKHKPLYIHPALMCLGFVLDKNNSHNTGDKCPIMLELEKICHELIMININEHLAEGNVNYTKLFYENETKLGLRDPNSKYPNVKELLITIDARFNIRGL